MMRAKDVRCRSMVKRAKVKEKVLEKRVGGLKQNEGTENAQNERLVDSVYSESPS